MWFDFIQGMWRTVADLAVRFLTLDLGVVHMYTLVILGVFATIIGKVVLGGGSDE